MMTADDVRDKLREACAELGSQKAWAKRHGVGDAYVSDILAGRREPGESVLKGLRLKRVVSYAPLRKATLLRD